MARKTLTDKGVAALKSKSKQHAYPDPEMKGHYVRVTPSGTKTFYALARDPRGKQVWTAIENASIITIENSREKAREIIARVKSGQDRAGPQSFESIINDEKSGWLVQHVEKKKLRSTAAIKSYLARFILPAWGGRDFESIKRSDVTQLMDHVEAKAGPVAADRMLTWLSSIFTWYATRHDDYTSPIIRGMRRTSTKERARERILSDDEIRTVWNACDGTMGDIVKLLLLTAQRRDKVVTMRWDDIANDGTWDVKNGHREKGAGGELVLPPMAMDIIKSRLSLASNPFVFPGIGAGHYTSYAAGKTKLDEATRKLPHWQLHDLRRTARSLMSRAGVRPDVSERVLGHVQAGVLGTYDRHSYREEKRHALEMLARLIATIINGDTDEKVVKLAS